MVVLPCFSISLPRKPPPTAPPAVLKARPLPPPKRLPITPPITAPATAPTPEVGAWCSTCCTDSTTPQLWQGAAPCATGAGVWGGGTAALAGGAAVAPFEVAAAGARVLSGCKATPDGVVPAGWT